MTKRLSMVLAICLLLTGGARLGALAAGEEPRGAVSFGADGAALSGAGLSMDDDGQTVRVTEAGTYEIAGVSARARIVVEADERLPVTLVLAGADLANEEREVLYFQSAGGATLSLAAGTENRLACGVASEEDEDADENDEDDRTPKGAVRAKCPLTITGSGSLEIESRENHGIFAAETLSLEGGTITVRAANDAIHGKEDIAISGGTFSLEARHDGIQAGARLSVSGGVFTIHTGVGAAEADMKTGDSMMMGRPGGFGAVPSGETADTGSQKGLKAGEAIEITGGEFDIDAEDDAVHSDGEIVIAGGALRILSGDDGVHADERLTVRGGVIDIGLSYEGLEAPNLLVEDGQVRIVAVDDGMNANGGAGMFGPFASRETSDAETPVLRITGGVVIVDAGATASTPTAISTSRGARSMSAARPRIGTAPWTRTAGSPSPGARSWRRAIPAWRRSRRPRRIPSP